MYTLCQSRLKEISPIVLAFVGDSYYTLYIRSRLACTSDCKANILNSQANSFVRAPAQAVALELIFDQLTEEEREIAIRARNSRTTGIAKNSSVSEYKKSTAFEAVLGYLYLGGNTQRLEQLLKSLEQAQQKA